MSAAGTTIATTRGGYPSTVAADCSDSSHTVVADSSDSCTAAHSYQRPEASRSSAEPTMLPHGDPATRRRRGHKRCSRCLKLVPADWYRLHRIAHVIQGADGINLPAERRCARCTQADRKCRVAIQPRTLDTPTLRCTCCLLSQRECSLSSRQNWEMAQDELAIHPAI